MVFLAHLSHLVVRANQAEDSKKRLSDEELIAQLM